MSTTPKPGTRPYITALRAELIGLGYDGHAVIEAIALNLRSHGKRPREAWRLANELSLDATAARFSKGRDRPVAKNRIHEFEVWPSKGGARPSLPTLQALAQIFGCGWDQLVDLDDLRMMGEDDRSSYHAMIRLRQRSTLGLAAPPASSTVSRSASSVNVVEAAAEESAEMLFWMAASNVDDHLLDGLDLQVRGIASAYLWSPPLPLLDRTRRLRAQVAKLLQGRQSPTHTTDLYLINARLCTILAWMAGDLGNYGAAAEHSSAAWMAANLADHDGARTWVRATQSKLAYWSGGYRDSAELAADGLTYQGADSAVLLLRLLQARAYARVGNVDQAEAALRGWQDSRNGTIGDDAVGGLLGLSDAQQHYLAGSVLLELRRPDDALQETRRALALFEKTPSMERFIGAEVLARIDAVRAHLDGDDLDGVAEALQPVLALDTDQRLDTLSTGLSVIQHGLAGPRYRDTALAQNLQTAIGSFVTDTASRQLELRT